MSKKTKQFIKDVPLLCRYYSKKNIDGPDIVPRASNKRFYFYCHYCTDDYLRKPSDLVRTKNLEEFRFCCMKKTCREQQNHDINKFIFLNKGTPSLDKYAPDLILEWDNERNKYPPSDYSYGAEYVAHWVCQIETCGHKWQRKIAARTTGQKAGCPKCAGKLQKIGSNNVKTKNNIKRSKYRIEDLHEFAKRKNGKCLSNEYENNYSNIKWKCEYGHIFNMSWGEAIRLNSWCPKEKWICRDISKSLLMTHPELAKEWDYDLNTYRPEHYRPASNKNVFWVCQGNEHHRSHSYKLPIIRRALKKCGCSVLSNKKVSDENNINVLFPNICKYWHTSKNGDNKPSDFVPGSNKLIWWICENDNSHIYELAIKKRVKNGNCCDQCKMISVIDPKVSLDWDYEKNYPLTPENTPYNYSKRVWWKCHLSKNHTWTTTPGKRTRDQQTGCPFCGGQSSKLEKRIYSELSKLFDNVRLGERISGKQIDVYLKNDHIAIEIDGYYWHKEKYKEDVEKNKLLEEKGLTVIRIREGELPKINPNDIITNKSEDHTVVMKLLSKNLIQKGYNVEKLTDYVNKGVFINDNVYKDLLNGPLIEESIVKKFPHLLVYFDYDKNPKLNPHSLTPKNQTPLWWKCPSGKHSWEDTCHNMTVKSIDRICGRCSKTIASPEYNLETEHPIISEFWDYERNECSPNELLPHTPKYFHVKCNVNPNHVYQFKIQNWLSFKQCHWCNNPVEGPKTMYKTFEDARQYVVNLGLNSYTEWKTYSKNNRPNTIPSNPNKYYKNNGWISCQHWIGKT